MTCVPLDDPRLVVIVAPSLDDPGPSDDVQLPPRPSLSLRRDGDIVLFKTGELMDGTPNEVAARIESGAVLFFPQRSSADRQLLAALGINE